MGCSIRTYRHARFPSFATTATTAGIIWVRAGPRHLAFPGQLLQFVPRTTHADLLSRAGHHHQPPSILLLPRGSQRTPLLDPAAGRRTPDADQ